MALAPLESFEFGGVDSRSNPLNFPRNRSLRMRNWSPQDSGIMQLRYGFSTVSQNTATVAAFQNLIPFSLYNANTGAGTDYLILGQGTATFKLFNIGTSAVTTPALRGASFTAAARGSYYGVNNHIYFGNGTDQKWTDGTTWRDSGLRQLTTAELVNVQLFVGISELTSTQRTAVAANATNSGSFTATILSGFQFFVSAFDTLTNEVGPGTQPAPLARVTVSTASQKISFTGLPVYGLTNQIKLISRTIDGGASALFCANTGATAATLVLSGSTATMTAVGHGYSTGDIIMLAGFTDTKYIQPWSITVTGVNTFMFVISSGASLYSASDSGTAQRIVSVAFNTTTVDITNTATAAGFQANQPLGLAATSTSLANPGYQLYASIYNRTGGQHVGNRRAFGSRFTLTVRSNVRIYTLPDLTGTDSEWELLIGRTGDGGEVPYVIIDNAGNFANVKGPVAAAYVLNDAAIDGTKEMPLNNGIIPAGLAMFCTPGDHIQGAKIGVPTVYISGSEADSQNGDFVGDWAQAWAPQDIETFPTAQGLTGCFEVEGEAFYGTKNHGAILSDATGARLWRGPWYGAGMAGIRSWCDTPFGNFWVTGHKQLATLINGVPAPVSDEYEAALLSRIGDAFLSQVEAFHIQDVAKRINHILIKCLDSSGVPFEVIHDFRLRDSRSSVGQAYEFAYSAPLATDFVLAKSRISTGLDALWAGASNGQLYQLHSGANDAGTEYSADALFMVNAGPNRPSVPDIRWFGDQNVIVSIGRTLNSTLDAGTSTDLDQITPSAGASIKVSGGENDFQFKAPVTIPEMKSTYVRMQLTSHSADGNLDLNNPPHIPLENYGRVFLTQALVGTQRGV